MLNLVSLIAELRNKFDIILVTSGAVMAGYTALKIDKNKPISKKVLASAGQPILMSSYKNKFDIFDIDTAQILLTEEDFDSIKRIDIFSQIITMLLSEGVIPIVNENDISTTPEQVFGDNDQLSANVAHTTNAEILVILSDIEGYYDKNPKKHKDAKIRKFVSELTEEELNQNETANHKFATGGIVTKLKAGQFLLEKNKKMFLCSGFDLTAIRDFLLKNKHSKGTLFAKLKSEKEFTLD
jgi:glutamate 5-kinase